MIDINAKCKLWQKFDNLNVNMLFYNIAYGKIRVIKNSRSHVAVTYSLNPACKVGLRLTGTSNTFSRCRF